MIYDTENGIDIELRTPDGVPIQYACACDTDAGWIELRQVSNGIGSGTELRGAVSVVKKSIKGSLLVLDGKLAPPLRVWLNYDVCHKSTGDIIHCVRRQGETS